MILPKGSGMNMLKKQLPNIITGTRILGAVVLLFFREINTAFLCIYSFCGFTDLIDGPVARKLNAESNVGALLDTVGDVATYVALAKILLSKHLVPLRVLIWYVSAAALIVSSGFIAFARFRKFFIVHSLFGKLMGFLAFTMPFALRLGQLIPCFVAICVSATVSAVETAVITGKADDPEHAPISLIGFFRAEKAAKSSPDPISQSRTAFLQ